MFLLLFVEEEDRFTDRGKADAVELHFSDEAELPLPLTPIIHLIDPISLLHLILLNERFRLLILLLEILDYLDGS